jgi:hypothetical protein
VLGRDAVNRFASDTRATAGGVDRRKLRHAASSARGLGSKAKQGAGFGHTKVGGYPVLLRGLSPLMATISTDTAAPVIAGTRLRGGNAGSARGAASLVAEALGTAREIGAGSACGCREPCHGL